MAIYLGQNKVSPMFVKTIEKTVTINNGSTTTTYNTNTNFVQEDPDNLASDLPVVEEWTRPEGWPNLDSLPALTEGVYLTYDNTSKIDYKWASFRCWTNSSTWTVALGHVANNTWVQDSSWNVNSNTVKEIDYSGSSYDYVVFKITPTGTNHITQFYFASIAQATLGTYALRHQYDQYCLERVGKLPYVTTLSGSGEAYRYCTQWMERDKVEFGNAITNLSAGWYRARKLQKLEFGNWTGENCNVTTLASAFEQCISIEELDLSCWNTTNWHVTSIANLFYYCRKLKKINVLWNTVNWGMASISMANTFSGCLTLETIDLSSWNVSGWNCTTLSGCWSGCFRLKRLNVKNWNTTNWHVTTLYATFSNCRQLVDVDLSNWNTTNWSITSLYCTWYYNFARRNFNDIKNWITTNWNVTTMESTFNCCYRVQEIDLSGWNVSNWACTLLYSTWSNCQAMRSLKVGTWDMTGTNKWKVTNIAYIFNECNNLEDSTFFNWNTKNWAITRMGYAFSSCYKLKEIDLTKWNKGTWDLANGTSHFNYLCRYCRSAKKIDISVINPTNILVANYGSNATDYTNFYECNNLETLNLPANYAGHLHFRYDYSLSRTELVRIFNALPTALEGAKIVITEMRYKLTTADIAIATNKGYTVS